MYKKDITDEDDIKLLVDRFYQKVVVDPVIGFIFTEVVALSWDVHIPIMYAFWTGVLLGKNTYSGNPMQVHMALDKKITFEQEHFDTWLRLWEQTIRENFAGNKANEAVLRANNIGALMFHRVKKSRDDQG